MYLFAKKNHKVLKGASVQKYVNYHPLLENMEKNDMSHPEKSQQYTDRVEMSNLSKGIGSALDSAKDL